MAIPKMDVPLVVDLDETLLSSDILYESYISFLRNHPLKLFLPLFWLLKGKSNLKEMIAHRANVDVTVLPYNRIILEFLIDERNGGRQIILATGSHQIYADAVANHLGIFDLIMATQGEINLAGQAKRDALLNKYGRCGFDYIGNSNEDILIWDVARMAYVVDPSLSLKRKIRNLCNIKRVFCSSKNKAKVWLKAVRVHQWVKNLLIFVPLLASHSFNLELFFRATIAFLSFGLCVSSVYLLNDLLDLEDDRHHSKKKSRPFASGLISLRAGLLICPSLILVAFSVAYLYLPWQFSIAMFVYYISTILYSSILKRIMMIDVITLAFLYTLRIFAGAYAIDVELTFWMISFSMFIFLSLALVKRYAELHQAKQFGVTKKTRGRGYYPADLEMVSSLGASSGYLAVLVLALYIQDDSTSELYKSPEAIWSICPIILFWISRIWLIAHRGKMHEDPLVFAIKDKTSWLVVLFMLIAFSVAL